jgi:murein DD-endopeptidase MepM/ murein hydrolase activator NlpD
MDSIIARQKIGKRRPAPLPRDANGAFNYRLEGGAKPYSPMLLERARGKARVGKARPRVGYNAHSPGLGAKIALLIRRKRDRDPLTLGLRTVLRSFARRISRVSRIKLAAIAGTAVAGLAALSIAIAAIVQGPAFPLPSTELLPQEGSAQSLLLDFVSPELADGRGEVDQETSSLPPVPVTLEVSTYTVRSGDALASIAKRFGINIGTIISANGISSASSVKPGMQLRIPNINGLIHKVRPGDNLASIAKRYAADTTRIVDANDLGSSKLISGQSVFIPGAQLPDSTLRQVLGQKVAWPLRGALSSFFGYRPDPFTGVRRFHAGIDIVANSGTPVRAAMDGIIADKGYNANFGNYVIINHADGFQTLYGHLTSASITIGARVQQGSVIGISGNTGYSTGSHLHFGLFKRSLALNPLKYLK